MGLDAGNADPTASTRLVASALQLDARHRRQRVDRLWADEVTQLLATGETCTVISADGASGMSTATTRARRLAHGEGPGDFLLRQLIGRGGMSLVYEAEQLGLGRQVAVKVQQGADGREQFLAEAALIGLLEHPHVVPIYEVGEDPSGDAFYAMRKIDGEHWGRTIDTLGRERNLDILLKVADAIDHAHARGVLHCDLKPANVLLGGFGEVWVIDWGLAMRMGATGASPIAADGSIGGTPGYMAPEQALADPASIGPRTDVYLLGALLFRLCTGRSPHTGRDARDCLEQAAVNTIVAATDADGLLALALRAMADDPSDRYPTVAAFQQAIRDWRQRGLAACLLEDGRRQAQLAMAGEYRAFGTALFAIEEGCRQLRDHGGDDMAEELDALRRAYAQAAVQREDLALALTLLPPGVDDTLRRDVERRRRRRDGRQRRIRLLRRGILLTLALSLIGLLTVMAAVDTQRRQEENASRRAQEAGEHRRLSTVVHALAVAQAELTDDRRMVSARGLDAVPEELRFWAWRHLRRLSQPAWRTLELHEGCCADPMVCSPDGRWLATDGGAHLVSLWSMPDAVWRHSLATSGQPAAIDFTPDGQRVVIAGTRDVRCYRLSDASLLARWPRSLREMRVIDDRFLVGIDGSDILCLGISDGRTRWVREACKHVTILGHVAGAVVTERHDRLTTIPIDDPLAAQEGDKHPDLRWLAMRVVDGERRYLVLRADGGSGLLCADGVARWQRGLRNGVRRAALSADTRIYAVSSRNRREVHVRDSFGDGAERIVQAPLPAEALAFTDDGHQLLVGMRDAICVFDLRPQAAAPLPVDIDWQAGTGSSVIAGATVVIAEHEGPGQISGHADGSLRVWHPDLELPLCVFDCGAAVERLAWAGDELLVGLADGSIRRFPGSDDADAPGAAP